MFIYHLTHMAVRCRKLSVLIFNWMRAKPRCSGKLWTIKRVHMYPKVIVRFFSCLLWNYAYPHSTYLGVFPHRRSAFRVCV